MVFTARIETSSGMLGSGVVVNWNASELLSNVPSVAVAAIHGPLLIRYSTRMTRLMLTLPYDNSSSIGRSVAVPVNVTANVIGFTVNATLGASITDFVRRTSGNPSPIDAY